MGPREAVSARQQWVKPFDLRSACVDVATADLEEAHRQKLEGTEAKDRKLVTNTMTDLENGGWRQEFMGEISALTHGESGITNGYRLSISIPSMVPMAKLDQYLCYRSTRSAGAGQHRGPTLV